MRKVILGSILVAALCCSQAMYGKENMIPPKPVDNKAFDSLVGTWKGQSEMMGTKMNDTLKISWSLNHQYLMIELKSKEPKNSKNNYEGLGLFGINKDGTVKTWWFDNWGAQFASTGTGATKDNMLTLSNSNQMFKEEREFKVNGNEMKMHAKGSMIMDGKEEPFEQNVVYKK